MPRKIFDEPRMETFQVVSCPTTDLSFTNKAILNPLDNFAEFPHIAVRYPKKAEAFVFSVMKDETHTVQKGKIAFNLTGRKWAGLMLNSTIEAAPYKFDSCQCLNTISFFIDFASRQNAPVNTEFDTDQMAQQFSQKYHGQAFTVGQLFGFPFQHGNRRIVFELTVKEMQAINMSDSDEDVNTKLEIGLTTPNTVTMFERAEKSDVKLTGRSNQSAKAPQIFGQDWDFANMGVGGLSQQFNKIFRRAFASRLLPPQFAESIGEEHVRGILLHGPPGTGKTLIARQIGKMLLAREPKVVNGPELLNKYVGESEANIRKLFAEAEEEQAKAGMNSGLHVIIFDEIDALCKARGTSAGSAGVGDNVVNQLLTKIDGVNSLNNVLLIGMTNRRDLIDEALLRPGRLEVQIEIGLPNKQGRLEIFEIHTMKMRKKGILDESVNLEDLAEVTKNYTGAEIAGLIRAARSLAVNRVVRADSKVSIDQDMLESIKVTRADFEFAMKHDVKPALGASEDQLKTLSKRVIHWDPVVERIQSDLHGIIRQLKEADEDRPYFVVLLGEPGAGTTTLAAEMASKSEFPFIRVYQSRTTAAKSESAKVQYIEKLFDDAARSELSCIVMDGLEVILDYCHIGPRFSNTTRNVFVTNLDLTLPKGHRMLVVCTCKYEQFMDDLLLNDIFRDIVKIPPLTRPEQVARVLSQLQETGSEIFTQNQCKELVEALSSIPFKMGIKRVEELIKNALRDEPDQRVKKFLQRMHTQKLVVRTSRLESSGIFGNF